MGKKLSKEEFINRSILVHDNRYDYSLVEYKNAKSKVKIICPVHGIFEQIAQSHLDGQNCRKCRTTYRIPDTTANFIKKSKEIHGSKYDYSLVQYEGNKKKVKIICPIHGVFEQIAANHTKGCICPKCSAYNTGKRTMCSTVDFIKKAKEIHGNKYDYSLVQYEGSKTKVKIICPVHGKFEQTPNMHLNGSGCLKCSLDEKSKKYRNKIEHFINISNRIHNNKYDYSLVNYINNRTKVKIICPVHGEFKQTPYIHTKGSGCPTCCSSKGELYIEKYLNKHNLSFLREKTFNECRYCSLLFFDFYLSEYNLCIEYDGIQHFKPIEFWGGEKSLKENKIRDSIKTEYCKNSGIKLLRIKYTDDIDEKLNRYFNLNHI